MRFRDLIQHLPAGPASDPALDPEITGLAALEVAGPGSLTFVENRRYQAQLSTTQASAVLLPDDPLLHQLATERGLAWLSLGEPRLGFALALGLFHPPLRFPAGRHPTASVDPSATLGEGVSLGPGAVLYHDVVIGSHVQIGANTVLYPGVVVGDRTVIHASCVLYDRTQVGQDCLIHSGVVIGADGFGFVPTLAGWLKVPQTGYVVLENDVEVGANAALDRPAVGETRIGRGTKLDNLVHVGHGCQIGQHCVLAAQVGLAGGVHLEDWVVLGGQVGVNNKVRVGRGAQASAKSGLHTDIEAGAIVGGYPAIPIATWRRAVSLFNRFPDLYKTLQRMQKHLNLPPLE